MTKPELHGRVVRAEIRIRATPEEVYRAWADPAGIARWFVDRAEGKAAPGEVMTWHFADMAMKLPVPVTEVEEGRRLLISGQMPDRPPFVQEIVLDRDGDHTVLRLVNSGFREGAEWDEEYEGVVSGWTLALATLKHQLEEYPGQDRAHALFLRPAVFEYEDIPPLFVSADGLESWLGGSAAVDSPEAGGRVSVDIPGAGPLNGSILARSAWEVLVSWPERDATLALKAFGGGGGRMVALDYSTWAGGAAARGPEPEVREALEAAVQRLAEAAGKA